MIDHYTTGLISVDQSYINHDSIYTYRYTSRGVATGKKTGKIEIIIPPAEHAGGEGGRIDIYVYTTPYMKHTHIMTTDKISDIKRFCRKYLRRQQGVGVRPADVYRRWLEFGGADIGEHNCMLSLRPYIRYYLRSGIAYGIAIRGSKPIQSRGKPSNQYRTPTDQLKALLSAGLEYDPYTRMWRVGNNIYDAHDTDIILDMIPNDTLQQYPELTIKAFVERYHIRQDPDAEKLLSDVYRRWQTDVHAAGTKPYYLRFSRALCAATGATIRKKGLYASHLVNAVDISGDWECEAV